MQHDPYMNMRLALEIESQSLHPEHKVGALICGRDSSGQPFAIARANFWPPLLEEHIGRSRKLGNASTTVHAEIAAICNAPATEGAELYLTDLPCPNCAKAMAESRIGHVYIDSHTHNTPLGLKIKPFFDEISLPILMSAGIEVTEMDVTAQSMHKLTPAQGKRLTPVEHPIIMRPTNAQNVDAALFDALIREHAPAAPFAACFGKSIMGNIVFMLAREHRAIGLNAEEEQRITRAQDKYSATLQPVNRLLLNGARHGLRIMPDYLYSSQTPTAREFVNLIGAGYSRLIIGDQNTSRDDWGMLALSQIKEHNILEIA